MIPLGVRSDADHSAALASAIAEGKARVGALKAEGRTKDALEVRTHIRSVFLRTNGVAFSDRSFFLGAKFLGIFLMNIKTFQHIRKTDFF